MDTLTFFFDRCFGKRFPLALETAKPPFLVEYHHNKRNRFKQDMKDDDWLKICGVNGWIAFSHDRKFHQIEVEAEAIKQHNVGAFSLCGANDPTWDKLNYFVRAYPKVVEIIASQPKPYMYRIHPSARIERVWLP